MSLSMSVLLTEPIPTPVEVQNAARMLGYEVVIDDAQKPFDVSRGFRPMTFGAPRPMEAGVEIYTESASDFAPQHGVTIDPQFPRVMWFRWSSSFESLYSALVISAALANLGNKVFDDEEGAFKPMEELIADAQSTLRFIKP